MIVQMEYTVNPSVTANNPDEYLIKLGKGTLTEVTVTPAPGPNWEVYIRFLHLENPIIPDDVNEWIPLERTRLEFHPMFDQWSEIYVLKVQLCSPQARYPHNVQVMVTLQEQETNEQLLSSLIEKGF